MTKRHPAKYSKGFAKRFAEILVKYGCRHILDPFAGVGGIVEVHDHGYTGTIVCNEIEEEWALDILRRNEWRACGLSVHIGDAESLPLFWTSWFDAAVTSVTYGNRMADHHDAKDGSRRNTYKHALERDLTPGNTGAMHFGTTRKTRFDYCTKHKRCYIELRRVLVDGAIFVLNVSDHIRKGRRMRVTLWHRLCLQSLGFEVIEEQRVATPRNRQGANGDKRVEYESIIVFRLNKRGDAD
jgi:tRNA G10  N-methylase Trm11